MTCLASKSNKAPPIKLSGVKARPCVKLIAESDSSQRVAAAIKRAKLIAKTDPVLEHRTRYGQTDGTRKAPTQ